MSVTIELETPVCVLNQVRVQGRVIATDGELPSTVWAQVIDDVNANQQNGPGGTSTPVGFAGAFDFTIPSMGTTGMDRVHVWVTYSAIARMRSVQYATCSMQPPGP